MIVEPERYLEDFARAGADALTVHVEAAAHLHRTVQAMRAMGVAAGVALNPATPLGALEEVLPLRGPGAADERRPRLRRAGLHPRQRGQDRPPARLLDERGLEGVDLAVDGGIGEGTIGAVARAGATVAVAGSAVFGPGEGGPGGRWPRTWPPCGARPAAPGGP